MTSAIPPFTAWRPLAVDEAMRVFDPLDAPWWVAGGIAVDLYVGDQTRAHADIDIAMLRAHAPRLSDLFDEFELYIPHDGTLTRWHGESLRDEHHQFWARRLRDDAWAFEVLLERHKREDWMYRRDPRVHGPIDAFGRIDRNGAPYVRPAIALLYKSNKPDLDRNARDFESALPVLPAEERRWLRDALRLIDTAHPWIERLTP